jgi:amino acid permease
MNPTHYCIIITSLLYYDYIIFVFFTNKGFVARETSKEVEETSANASAAAAAAEAAAAAAAAAAAQSAKAPSHSLDCSVTAE